MSLVEVLLAVVLMSIVVLGIAAGFQTTAKVSGDAGARATLQGALNAAADRVATLPYPGCATASELTATARAAGIAPAGYVLDIDDPTNLVPEGPCTAATSAVRVTVRLTAERNPATTMTGDVVLRDPAARPA